MILVVFSEPHFLRSPDGHVWTPTIFPASFWNRYLAVFDGVRVVARVRNVASLPSQHLQVDGPGITVHAVPDYLGPWQYLIKAGAVRRAVESAVGPKDAVIMRIASQLANSVFSMMLRQSRPYGVEVVGDPWEVFAPGVVRHLLRPVFRRHFAGMVRSQCAHASAAAYVTERVLQQRYPVSPTVPDRVPFPGLIVTSVPPLAMGVSDVDLSSAQFVPAPRTSCPQHQPPRLILVGSLAQLYKGPDVAIQAVAACLRAGLEVRLTIVGEGRFRPYLERMADRSGVAGHVLFRGQLPAGAAVLAELDRSDLFIMPSRTEGLPRAMVEAMSRALPCIGSAVGGIPELIPSEDLIPAGDAVSLANKIREVLCDPQRMRRMSVRNLQRAKDFSDEALHGRRVTFYRFLRERTEEWIDSGHAVSEPCLMDETRGTNHVRHLRRMAS